MNVPPVDRRIVEAMVEDWLPHAGERRLLLVYGRYVDTVTEFPVLAGARRRRVHVADQHSVLGLVEAWQEHERRHVDDEDLLVVTTTVPDDQLGWDLRAYAIGRSTRTVDRAKIVAQRFGAKDVDARIRRDTWLVDALLDAEPSDGWPRNGSILTRDSAVRALIGARLGGRVPAEGALDAGALLEWSRDPDGPSRFKSLADAERDGLVQWLVDTVGEVAAVVMRLVADGRASDAVPLGIVGSAVTAPGASVDTAFAFGSLLGGTRGEELRTFTDAVSGALERWVSEAANRNDEAARHRVFEVLRRADRIAAEAHLTDALVDNRFLPSTFMSRLRTLAAALPGSSRHGDDDLESALSAVRDHVLARLENQRVSAAEMAVRLARWWRMPTPAIDSVSAGVEWQMTIWAWVDRALTTLSVGDPESDPAIGQAYRGLHDAVRARRDELDEQFAHRLASWAKHATATNSGECLLVEQVLTEIAVPVAGKAAPLVVVLDGMSAAVAVELGEQLTGRVWTEVTPVAGRRVAAVAALPSVTRVSRASLLTGEAQAADQAREKEGFAGLWRKRRRPGAVLFHKGDLTGNAGHRLADQVVAALSESEIVVGVVLNTIDDALDHGQEGDRAGWSLNAVTFLPELLDAARAYGRPVVLVSDHGHVLDRPGNSSTSATGIESARWRTGVPGAGEIAVTGPRAVYGNGELVMPWREDIRYTARKAGYHGGASLAEMTVPVMVILPSLEQLPIGWHVLPKENAEPEWWSPRPVPVLAVPKPVKDRKPKPEVDAVPLFTVESPGTSADSLGTQVVATDVYGAQRGFVRNPPERPIVAAIIDALLEADGVLTLAAVAAVAGRGARRPEYFAATLQRLLNVDGYPVLSLLDGGSRVKLDREVLLVQFGVRAK
ncbi:alkaline phosphatase [Actinosynnema sp. ALI-1.44]|uniref:BREX-2 system phosphatase PglZ n=1 Tax=Actinosynnema sp. ALI-1.44 TaxID=1933779 RepID=UPI00097BB50E|nr:BREX-2 system phosphatase PglZ [Actinosynnema sp. ALI-1.44]ONI70892.1 alkaline phosphatase [Actinosynnema sp. ALI-1.44]